MDELKRCHWKGIEDPVYQQYHEIKEIKLNGVNVELENGGYMNQK